MFPLGPLWTALVFLPGEITKQIFGRILAAIVFSGGGYFFPKLWLKFLISRRRKMIADQLQDALLNIADALKSGHVIQEAIRIVGTEMPYPIGMEFEKTHREMEAGKTLNQALTDMKKRISLPDFDMAVSAMEIQFEVGGKLEPLLRNMVRIINERADLRKEIEKTIAGSKTVGIVLLSAPIFFVVTFTMLQKNTYIQMFHSGFGIIMIIVAIICYIIAAIIIFAIIKSVSEDT
jgi:tight adherence protein B